MVGGPLPEPGHREQRPQRRFHDPSCRVGGRIRNRDRWDESAAGVALGRDAVVAGLARDLHQRRAAYRCRHPGGRKRVGGRLPDGGGRDAAHADRARIGRDGGRPNDGTSATDNSLIAIGGTQATGLWAVGWRESPSGLQPLVLRYDTTRPSPAWVSVSGAGGVPAPGVIDTVLTGIDVRSA